MKIRTMTQIGPAMWRLLASILVLLVMALACTPAQRQAVDAAAKAKIAEVKACGARDDVKACEAAVYTTCVADTIVLVDNQCVTRDTADRLAACFRLCEADAGAS
jgi:hypothetical protein